MYLAPNFALVVVKFNKDKKLFQMIHGTVDKNTTNSDLEKFSNILEDKRNDGFVVVERNDKLPYAVLVKKKTKVDHVSNFVICCATLGLWSIAWIYIAQVSSRARKILVAIDEDGNPFEENCYMG